MRRGCAVSEPFPEFKADPWDIYTRAVTEHNPHDVDPARV